MIIIGAVLSGFRLLKDKSINLSFETQEPTPEQVLGIAQHAQKFGYLAFKHEPFSSTEKQVIDDLKADYDDRKKTPGQRLRGVLYRLYEQNNEGYSDFMAYYNGKMEGLIEHFKKKLP